jgi:hypothetical protein
MQSGWFQFARQLAVLSPRELVRRARKMANRELTKEEVREYFGEFFRSYAPLWQEGDSGKQ